MGRRVFCVSTQKNANIAVCVSGFVRDWSKPGEVLQIKINQQQGCSWES
jgi:hypothetical protein